MRPAIQPQPAHPRRLCCSMCGKSSTQVRYLMAGAAGGHLCDGCTYAAMKIVLRTRLGDVFKRQR